MLYTVPSNQLALESVLGQPDQVVLISWTDCREFLPKCAEASITKESTIL